MAVATPELTRRIEDGQSLSTLVWRFPAPVRCVSTAAIGGGLTEPSWLVNAQVPHGYARTDLTEHAAQIAAQLHLQSDGIVMLTAVDVAHRTVMTVDTVTVVATVGVSDPVWAADVDAVVETAPQAGTVNIVALVPVALSAAAMINFVATLTEAKCQAFAAALLPGTGTPSDAVAVICPRDGEAELFGGPRSRWGRPAAQAAYDAITAGLRVGDEPLC